MRNLIKYYYNIETDNIRQFNKIYKFKSDEKKYVLYPYYRSIEELKEIYEICINIQKRGYYCHEIIKNVNNSIITHINGVNYILLKIYILDNKISLKDIYAFSQTNINTEKYKYLYREDWYNLWQKKIDYVEYQISQFGKKFPLIRESSDYYIGIVENCILLLYFIKDEKMDKTISHNRINNKTTLFDLYNPLNFIIDYKVRNFAEYVKKYIYDEKDLIYDVKRIIYFNKLEDKEIIYLFVRIIYPSIYFDICEEIINGKIKEQELKKIVNQTEIYEKNIRSIYSYIIKNIKIPEIDWLVKYN